MRVRAWRLLLAGLLWVIGSVGAQERVQDVLADLHAHGYSSLSGAIARVQSAQNAPDAKASLSVRARYHRTLLDLALRGRHEALALASANALRKMAKDEGCVPCQFDAVLADYRGVGGAVPGAEESAKLLEEAETLIPKGDSEAMARYLVARADFELEKGKLNLAIASLLEASDYARQAGDVALQLMCLSDTVGKSSDLGDSARALATAKEVAQRAEEIGFTALLPGLYLDLGHTYAQRNERENQRIVLEKSLRLAGKDPDLAQIRIIALNNLSDYWLTRKNGFSNALAYAREGKVLAESIGRPQLSIAPQANVGIALAGLGQVEAGISELRDSIKKAQKYNAKVYIIGINQELVRVLKQAGRYREAVEALESIQHLQEEQTQQERETAVLELQEKYATERKSEQIEKLTAQNRLKAAKLEAEGLRQRLWIALAVVLGLSSVFLVQFFLRARRANQKLASVNAELEVQSATDPLTGAFNRRYIQVLLSNLQAKLQQESVNAGEHETTGFMLLDLDFFKKINDVYGHAAGDAVLVEVVKRLRARLRQSDVVARWGGEEFVLILPNTSVQSLQVVANNVLIALGNQPVEFEGKLIPVTVSIGGIAYPAVPHQAWEAALGVADSALYMAKASGRNQAVCIFAIDVSPECNEADLVSLQAEQRAQLKVIMGPVLERAAAEDGSTMAT